MFRIFTLPPCLVVTLSSFLFASDFTITNEPAGPPLVGFGAQMNPYLYCRPNDLEIDSPLVKDFENKVLALKPQHVRVFYLQKWFNNEADVISKGDPKTAESFIRTCALAQAAGATINLTYWYGPWIDPDKQMSEFAETLDKLIEGRKLTSIRYVTIQNEVNGGEKVSKETYTNLYRALDANLRRLRRRESINIISGDLVQDNQRDWFTHIGNTIADVSDGYSIHVYWDYWDTAKLLRRISEVPDIVQSLPREQQRPLYVTEFGVRGHRDKPSNEPGTHEDGTPIALKPLQANQLARFTMEGLNRGYLAFVIWTMEDAWYDRFMPYGVIGSAKDNWPLKPSYHMLRLFTHTTKPGWRALKIVGKAEGKLISATRGDKGELTIYALNPTDKPSPISLAGLAPSKRFNRLIWNKSANGALTREPPIQSNPAGGITLQIPPLALIALTTLEDLPK